MNVDDADLVRRVARGDDRAFEALVDRHYTRCLRFAWRQLGNRADAEEAVQDAFVRAYRALTTCSPERFRSWLTSILVNRCRSRGARAARGPVLEPIARHAERLPVAAAEFTDLSRTAVGRALATLPDLLREAFLLRHVEELGYDEIARITGAGRSAVRMRVMRAGRQLAEALADAEEDDGA